MKAPIDYTYHCHTYRCGHATGEDEEYVLAALEAGFKILGFSDHVIFKDLSQKHMRGEMKDLAGYFRSARDLAEKYRDRITIYLGFEAEWFKEYAAYYKELLDNGDIDYLILGNHLFMEDGKIRNFESCGSVEKAMRTYVDGVVEGIRSGLFKYVAHPDFFTLFTHGEWNETIKTEALRIVDEAESHGVPLEINLGKVGRSRDPYREHLPYPSDDFWKLVEGRKIKAIIGADAHEPGLLLSTSYQYGLDFAKKHGLELIDRLDITRKG